MIVYFSGTGNTRRCALHLAELLGENVHELSPAELREPGDVTLSSPDSRVIWAFPTYSWGVPPVIVRFIKNVKFGGKVVDASNYMLATCGDDMAYTDRQWRRLMERRGLSAAGAFAVIMPNTYTLMKGFDVDSAELACRKVAESDAQLVRIAEAIAEGGDDILIRGSYPWVKSAIVYPWFVRFAMSPKPFRATGGCTGCGLCSRTCPMANITSDDKGRPRWGADCALCLRCYHSCPRHAIAYGHATDGKGQWLCKK